MWRSRWTARRGLLSPVAALLALTVLGSTVLLSALAHTVSQHNETRLLKLKVAETGSVLQALVPSVETPLRSAAEITNASAGDRTAFREYIRPFVGAGKPFVAASLWRIAPGPPVLITSVGPSLVLQRHPTQERAVFARSLPASGFRVTGFLGRADRRLGYAFTTAVPRTRLAVYAEGALPPTTRVRLPAGGPFSDLRFELYLGRTASPSALLYGNVGSLPARRATVTVPFGDTSLTLVGAPARPLAGALATSLWWIVLLAGLLLTAGVAATTERLLRSRARARELAARLETSLAEQRSISAELQHALLPQQLPDVAGVRSAARYLVGTEGMEIGGDWYDVVALEDGRVFFTLGDVSGRGVGAGSVMARLQYAARALVLVDPSPAAVLGGLSRLLDLSVDGHFATVLCGLLDPRAGDVRLATAGHFPPLLVDTAGAGAEVRSATVPTGVPIGVLQGADYPEVRCALPPAGALIAFTDGLVERRGEVIDVGIERVAAAAAAGFTHPEDLIERLVATRGGDLDDDTAVIALTWTRLPAGEGSPAQLRPAGQREQVR